MTKEKLTSLNEDQLKLLDQKYEEWVAIGLSTEPANREAAQEASKLAYRIAGLAEPTEFVWADNPLQAIHIQSKLSGGDIREWSNNCCWGQHDYWLSFYDTFDSLGIEGAEKIRGLVGVARNAGWWWPLEKTVVFSDRPFKLLRDNDNRLHCEDGPALSYRGDFHVYVWHGTRVPASMIEEDWDIERILSESNAEVRRCAIEKMGWAKFCDHPSMKKVAECDDPGNPPHSLSLWELPEELDDMFLIPDEFGGARGKILLCTNGTPEHDGTFHRFGLIVSPHHTDPVEAVAELYDMPVQAYRDLQVRT